MLNSTFLLTSCENDAASCIYLSHSKEYSFVLMQEKLPPRIWCAKCLAAQGSRGEKVSLSPQLARSSCSVKGRSAGTGSCERWSCFSLIANLARVARLLLRSLRLLLRFTYSDTSCGKGLYSCHLGLLILEQSRGCSWTSWETIMALPRYSGIVSLCTMRTHSTFRSEVPLSQESLH